MRELREASLVTPFPPPFNPLHSSPRSGSLHSSRRRSGPPAVKRRVEEGTRPIDPPYTSFHSARWNVSERETSGDEGRDPCQALTVISFPSLTCHGSLLIPFGSLRSPQEWTKWMNEVRIWWLFSPLSVTPDLRSNPEKKEVSENNHHIPTPSHLQIVGYTSSPPVERSGT